MGKLTGKVAIVAGAGRGIGRATAELLVRERPRVQISLAAPLNSLQNKAFGELPDQDKQEQTRTVAHTLAQCLAHMWHSLFYKCSDFVGKSKCAE